MHKRFEGRAAIVTGSSQGIGRAIAQRLAAEGAAVVLNGRTAEPLAVVAAEIMEAGGRAIFVAGSVSDPAIPGALVQAAQANFGRLDAVVNNVGISPYYGPLMNVDRERFSKTMVTNTWPAIALVQAAIAGGFGSGGAVLNISTIGAQQVQPYIAPYAASKAALDSLTKVMGRELGPRGIRVNGIAPGLIRTRTSSAISAGEIGDREAEILPLGRLGDPGDIASAAAFLLSGEASWITGETLVVDGGRLLIGDEPRAQIGVFDQA